MVEDISQIRQRIINLIDAHPQLELKSEAKNGKEALEKLAENVYDLVLLDINLPIHSGIEIAEKINEDSYIIFITSYDQHAVKAFELGAIDYLTKPFSDERFNQSIDRLIKRFESNEKQNQISDVGLSFFVKRSQCIISYEDIIYISSHRKHSVVHTMEKDFETAVLLKDIESRLPDKKFFRIHRQYIVNINFVFKLQHDSGGQYIVNQSYQTLG